MEARRWLGALALCIAVAVFTRLALIGILPVRTSLLFASAEASMARARRAA
jgi:hypothetical protein